MDPDQDSQSLINNVALNLNGPNPLKNVVKNYSGHNSPPNRNSYLSLTTIYGMLHQHNLPTFSNLLHSPLLQLDITISLM